MTWISNKVLALVAKAQARDEEGQGLAEYGLILALVAAVCVAAVTLLGGNIAAALEDVAGKIVPGG